MKKSKDMYKLEITYKSIDKAIHFEKIVEVEEDNYLDVIWDYIDETRDARIKKQKELGYSDSKPMTGLYISIKNIDTPVSIWRGVNATFN